MPKLIHERSIQFGGDLDRGHIYVMDDGDSETEEVRIQFVYAHGIQSYDFTPKQLYAIGKMIVETLNDAGFCEHGGEIGDCDKCTFAELEDENLEYERALQNHPFELEDD